MKPLLRSDYRLPVAPARDEGCGRSKPEARACHIEARACAGRALLLEADYTRRYDGRDSWHDPLSGHSEPFERALARARKDAEGGRLAPFARLVTQTEEVIARGDGWTAITTEHGVKWCEPNAEGTPRTLTEAVAVILARTARESTGDAPPAEVGRCMVREGYDQRGEGEGNEVSQAAADDGDMPEWVHRPPRASGLQPMPDGSVKSRGLSFEREFVRHSDSVAPGDGGGMPG